MRPGRLIAAVALASFIAGGAAFTVVAAPALHLGAFQVAAAKPSPSPGSRGAKAQAYCNAFLTDLAKRLGVSADKLKSDAKAAIKDQIDQAVKNGDLTSAQATKLKARVDAANGCQGLPGLQRRPAPGLGPLAQVIDAAASALKVSAADLRKDVMAGQSLSQVAASSHVTKADFDTAFRKALTDKLDPQVTAGKLTKDQETRMVDRAVALADQLWDKSLKDLMPGGGMGPRGFGGGFSRRGAGPFGGPGGGAPAPSPSSSGSTTQ